MGVVRTTGIVRARAKIGLMNLVYNVSRLVQLERMAAAPERGWNLCLHRATPPRCRAGAQMGPRRTLPGPRTRLNTVRLAVFADKASFVRTVR
jgi:hypothetical protein